MSTDTQQPWRHWPVAVRFTFATAMIIVAAVAGMSTFALTREERAYRAEMQQRVELVLDTLTASASDRLSHADAGSLSDLVSGLGDHHTVIFARIYDAAGRVIADARDPLLTVSPRRDPLGQRLVTSDAIVFEWQPHRLFAGRAVMMGRQRVGAIRVGMITASLEEKMGALRTRGMAGVLIAATFGAVMALLGGAFNAMAARLRETIESQKERETHYRLIMEHAGDIIYKTDAMGHLTFFNPTAVRTLGYSPEELHGRLYLDLIRPDFREAADRFYRTQLLQKTPRTYFEFPVVASDGREVWLGQSVEGIVDGDRVVGFQAIARDITDRKYSEATLRESESRFRALIENSSDGIALMGPDGTILYEGPSTQHILG